MKKAKQWRPFQHKSLAGPALTVLLLLSFVTGFSREVKDTIIPSTITARPTWIGPVDTAWFIVDLQNPVSTRKVSGITILQKAMKYTDSTAMLANYLAALNSHTSQLASHLTSINLNTNAIAVINVNLPKKVDSVKVNGSTLYYYANNGTAYPGGTVSTSGGTWGSITGTLSSQTDLQNALNGKANTSNTITINGSTQSLGNNPSFTVSGGNGTLDSTTISGFHTLPYYDARYLAPINTNTVSITSNTSSINTLNGYFSSGVLKATSVPVGTSSTLGGYKVGSGLAVDGNGVLSATGGTVYSLNNWQTAVFTYSGSNVFTLPQNASRVYRMTVYDTIQGTVVQVPIANFSFNGTNQVTFVQGTGSALQSGMKVWIDYDIGTANGTIASGTPQVNYVPTWDTTQKTAVWKAQIGGTSGNYLPIAGGTLTGTAGAGFIGFPSQSARPAAPASGTINEFTDSLGRRSYENSAGFTRSFDFRNTASDMVFHFQAIAGGYTIADSVAVAAKVDKTTMVNGHALSSNITIVPADLAAGTPTQTKFLRDDGTYVNPNTPVGQTYTTGTTVTVSNATTTLYVDPTVAQSTLTITLPASPSDGQIIYLAFGGTIKSGIMINTLTISPNTGQTILASSLPTQANAGDVFGFQYKASNTSYYRLN